MTTELRVAGHPAPQGSKRAFRNQHTGRIQQVENSERVAPWRQDVRQAVTDQALDAHYAGPVAVFIQFVFQRPKSHYRTGRNSHLLRDAAPPRPYGKTNDVDKLARAVLDALTSSQLLDDDGQVVHLVATKVYGPHSGAFIRVEEVTG